MMWYRRTLRGSQTCFPPEVVGIVVQNLITSVMRPSIMSILFLFLTTSCFCSGGARSSPSLGPVCCWSRLTVYCNQADSFLWPHFYEFSSSPLYCLSRPFIKQYVAAMFAYFLSLWPRNQNHSIPWVSAGPAAHSVHSLDKLTWGVRGFIWSILIFLSLH